MVVETITCSGGIYGGTCYDVDNNGASVKQGKKFKIKAPDGTRITWDLSNLGTLSNETLSDGQHTWDIPDPFPTGTYLYTPTDTGCDTQCGAPGKPSMVVD